VKDDKRRNKMIDEMISYFIHISHIMNQSIDSGELGKTTARHSLNKRSNRSHSIFTISLAQKPKSGVSEKTILSKLNLGLFERERIDF